MGLAELCLAFCSNDNIVPSKSVSPILDIDGGRLTAPSNPNRAKLNSIGAYKSFGPQVSSLIADMACIYLCGFVSCPR